MKPRLLDPAFRYTPSYETNIRKLFARVRREMAEREKQTQVVPIKRVAK